MAEKELDAGRLDEAVSVALQLFLEHGYDNTPMSLIASKLKLTKAGVYHYFESKEELLYIAHLHAMEHQLFPVLDAADNEPDPERRLRGFLFSYARMLALEPTAGLLIRESRRLAPVHLREVKKTWRRGLRIVRDAIADLQRQGRCASALSPTYAAFAAIGMASWISFWFDPKRPKTADAVASTMAEIFMAGLLAAKDGRVVGDAIAYVAGKRARRAAGDRPETSKLNL